MTSKCTAVLKIKRYVHCLTQRGVLHQTDKKMIMNRAVRAAVSQFPHPQASKKQKNCCSAVLCFAMLCTVC